jgi:hypothetical protein
MEDDFDDEPVPLPVDEVLGRDERPPYDTEAT